MQIDSIIVDPEISAICPPLSAEEKAALEDSLLSEGCRDALVVWSQTNILLDGHNRRRICEMHGLEYDVARLDLPSRDAAIAWVITNQLGRRNLHPDAASLLRGRLYNMRKKDWGGDRKSTYQSDTLNGETADRLAAEFGVSAPTIKRDGAFAQAVEDLAPFVPDIGERAMAGDIPSRKAVVEAAKDPEEAAPRLATHQLISQSNSNEWYTPREYVDAARAVMGGIDLDPASNDTAQGWIMANTYYTKEDDGLSQAWAGRVWLNPPWGRLAGEFVSHLVNEFHAGRVTEFIALVNAHSTDAQWFQPLWDGLLCFTNHRIDYDSETETANGSTHGSVFVYFGPHEHAFLQEFARWGAIVRRADGESS